MDELPSTEPSSGLPRTLKIGILAVLVCIVIAAGTFLALRLRQGGTVTNTATSSVETGGQTPSSSPQPSPIRSLQDSDGDRLSDQEEASLGTNPKLPDSDGDGLFDYEEAKIYYANPLNPDTDADTVSDGQEVRRGTNPLGTGESRNLNAAIANTNQSTNQ